MIMKNSIKTGALVLGTLLLSAFAFVTANENSAEDLSAQAATSTELFAVNTANFDGKCGEGEKPEKKEKTKKGEKKEESKCGEGKCGERKSATKKEEKKSENKTEEKKEEHKCGEGKCGGQ
jgi:uncharacterized low-complexity protein